MLLIWSPPLVAITSQVVLHLLFRHFLDQAFHAQTDDERGHVLLGVQAILDYISNRPRLVK